ncbi:MULTISPECIES: 2-C-methyl-D-erythritol 4-phosphate cytidylyltransferase [unclassified Janthinobacterium]|uniref:2-C-methyl-D-erythritol 4-phosphate cytidylyltransferase n=1 Tax=unclassified Janthinobacterium TaxID=2610881 RepID=UPI00161E2742|nr:MULTISPECIES: 2-C-methyl-D-erythritol 4-phosphate cytidylyltransferase [unclassified Janthinobacterium]MBB5367016.1 2-C-methyl-D-erythritol 4-phosphate cytidylyltransferase [Janthinobacterium sp. K2C7]MBB5380506.1 2-C-methyl-D-erythritol 4-phosphate cytidylyltransferase [Janthinobacterium sp. K2Li3]MBB5385398.1 2-C-methyl-D-erythritol 4-phosphate cytidylyltransferase [Janthinobacterium sp. K2E3]
MTTVTITPRYFALIPAAGVGARMQAASPKQYLPLAGKPMLRHALDAFLASSWITHTYVVVSADDEQIDAVVPAAGVTVLRCGGATRMETILNALQVLQGKLNEHDQVLVHDAARPGLTPALIEKLITETGDHPAGGLLALPVVDTVKRAGQGSLSAATVPRDGLWLAQTPQMFSYALLRRALSEAPDPLAITDDASAIEALGLSPKLIEGHPRNLKVTLPRDIDAAELYLLHSF